MARVIVPDVEKKTSIPETETPVSRLVVVSNREPYKVVTDNGMAENPDRNAREVFLEKTPGGLVSALDPMLRESGGLWICWEGVVGAVNESEQDPPTLADFIRDHQEALPYDISTVGLSEDEINHYYYGYANRRLWPLFHYFTSECDVTDDQDWPSYESANRKFAQTVLQETTEHDRIWVQDYQLCLVPGMIRSADGVRQIGFFCHIPFPSWEVFRILPRRKEILEGMLGSDLIGFHIPEYVAHFLESVEKLFSADDVSVDKRSGKIAYHGRTVTVAAFPISIDFEQIQNLAVLPETMERAREIRNLYPAEFLGIGVDRLDYTKGILERLEGLRVFFEQYPEYKKRLTYIQIAAPTRTEVESYQNMREQVELAVGRINGLLSEDNWSPVQYFYRSIPLNELTPYFMAADFALITPLRDGMNLVAKEFCAAKIDHGGALILSEFAGVASEFGENAFTVNPYDYRQVAEAIRQAIQQDTEIAKERMSRMREQVKNNDIHQWVRMFLERLSQESGYRAD